MAIAVYPGSFDPVTLGHIDVAARAAKVFDKVIMLVAVNPEKEGMIPYHRRPILIRRALKKAGIINVEAEYCGGMFIVDYCKENDASVIIRGMRGMTDFDEEIQMANINHKLNPDVETFLVPARQELSDLSSSVVRQLWVGGKDIACMVPEAVLIELQKKRMQPSWP